MWFISSIGVINYINLALIKDTLQSFVYTQKFLCPNCQKEKLSSARNVAEIQEND